MALWVRMPVLAYSSLFCICAAVCARSGYCLCLCVRAPLGVACGLCVRACVPPGVASAGVVRDPQGVVNVHACLGAAYTVCMLLSVHEYWKRSTFVG
jgi:hypothetical protein